MTNTKKPTTKKAVTKKAEANTPEIQPQSSPILDDIFAELDAKQQGKKKGGKQVVFSDSDIQGINVYLKEILNGRWSKRDVSDIFKAKRKAEQPIQFISDEQTASALSNKLDELFKSAKKTEEV